MSLVSLIVGCCALAPSAVGSILAPRPPLPTASLDAGSARAQATSALRRANDRQRPTKPISLRVSAANPTTLSIASRASKDNVRVTGYGVYLNGAHVGTTASPTYTYSRLTCKSDYSVGIAAFDAAGNRSKLALIKATTAACRNTTPPSSPQGLAQTTSDGTTATLSWFAAADNVGVVGYSVYLSGVRITTVQGRGFTYVGLSCGSSYATAVDAIDADGNRSARASFTVSTTRCPDTQAPSTPNGLGVTSTSVTSISLGWRPSSDDRGVVLYQAYVGGSAAGKSEGTSYTFASLACGHQYTLAVDAVDATGNRSGSASLVASTAPCVTQPVTPPAAGADNQAPTAPSSTAVGSASGTSIALGWGASSDNVGVVAYDVYRDGVRTATTQARSYTFAGLSCGESYTLTVVAVDLAGNRSTPAALTASTSACTDVRPPSTPSGLTTISRTAASITLSWQTATDDVGVSSYGIYVNGSRVAATQLTSYTLVNLSCGTTYALGVDAVDAAGNRSLRANAMMSTAVCSDTQAPRAPGVPLVSNPTGTGATLAWTAATDDVGVAGYTLYVNGSAAGTTTQTTYALSGLACATTYAVDVEAFDASGNRSTRVTTAVTTSVCAPSPPAGGGTTAVLWVAKTSQGGSSLCTRSSSAVTWSTAVGHICDQISTAVSKSQNGDTIYVKGGTYGPSDGTGQGAIVASDTSQLTADVTVSPAPGEQVTIAHKFMPLGSHVRLLGDGVRGQKNGQNFFVYDLNMALDDNLGLSKVGHDNSVQGLHVLGLQVTGQYNVTVRNTEVGPNFPCYGVDQQRDPADPPGTICPDDPPNYPFHQAGNILGRTVTDESKIGPSGGVASSYPHDITLDGVYFHDANSSTINYSDNAHNGCLFLISGFNLIIRNSRFERCVVYDIQVQDFTSADCCGMVFGPFHDVTLENNWFGQPVNAVGQSGTVARPTGCGATFACETNAQSDNQGSIQMGPKSIESVRSAPAPYNQTYWTNWLIRQNSFQTVNSGGLQWAWDYLNNSSYSVPTFSNVRVIGNTGGRPDANFCGTPGLTYGYNAFTGSVCSGTNSVVLSGLPFVDQGVTADSMNLHLAGTAGSTAADNLVSVTAGDYGLSNDIDGEARSTPRDAGADDR